MLDISQGFENVAGVVKTATFMSRRLFWAFISEIFWSCFCFWTLSWKFLDFGIEIWPLLSILQVKFLREKAAIENFESSLEFLIFNAFSWSFGEKMGGVAKFAFYLLPVQWKSLFSFFFQNVLKFISLCWN